MSDVTFIGTSDAFGAGGRRQSATFLRGAYGGLLLDCGGTTCTGLADLGIDRDEIDAILVSHFHGDHFGGIPLLLLAAQYEDERKHPIRIAGPPGIEARVRGLAAAMAHEIEGRDWSFPIFFEELPAGRNAEIGPVRVRSFETLHAPDANPHGMVLDLGDRRVAYSGDTGWFDALPEQVAGSDLFICECTYEVPGYAYHLNLETLLERRDRFHCGRLVLTHLGQQMRDREGACPIDLADDGVTLKL